MSSSESDLEVFNVLSGWTSESESDEGVPRRNYKERMNYLITLDSYEFQLRFRLDKPAVEQLVTEIHPYLRVTGARCFGVWKRRFPVISLTLRISLLHAHAVIIATAVLHNICRMRSIDVPPEVELPPEDTTDHQENAEDPANNPEGILNSERAALIANYFYNLQ